MSWAKAFYTESIKFAEALGLKESYVADAYLGMGECLVKEGNPEYALKFYKKAFEIGLSPATERKEKGAE